MQVFFKITRGRMCNNLHLVSTFLVPKLGVDCRLCRRFKKIVLKGICLFPLPSTGKFTDSSYYSLNTCSNSNLRVCVCSISVNLKHICEFKMSQEKNPPMTVTTWGQQPCSTQANLVEGSKPENKEDLIDLAEQIHKCDASVKAAAGSKLRSILEQMRQLQNQARRVLEEAKRDADLHHAACNFKKIPGKLYYLYKRHSGQTYFSILSPDEWGSSCPHEALGCYKLEFDLTWTLYEKIHQREEDNAMIEKLVNQQFQPSLTYEESN